jgi:hypothetical protein
MIRWTIFVTAIAFIACMGCAKSNNPTQQIKQEIPFSSTTKSTAKTALVPQASWITVFNEEPVVQEYSNGTSLLHAGDACITDFGATVTVVDEVQEGALLVEYEAPRLQLGTTCPTGVLFLLAEEEFNQMTELYYHKFFAMEVEKTSVEQILHDNYFGQETDAGEWEWVDVVNLEPVVQQFSNGPSELVYGDSCGIGSDVGNPGGTIRVRGKSEGRTLYEYTAYDAPQGTPCPSGVLFFR